MQSVAILMQGLFKPAKTFKNADHSWNSDLQEPQNTCEEDDFVLVEHPRKPSVVPQELEQKKREELNQLWKLQELEQKRREELEGGSGFSDSDSDSDFDSDFDSDSDSDFEDNRSDLKKTVVFVNDGWKSVRSEEGRRYLNLKAASRSQ